VPYVLLHPPSPSKYVFPAEPYERIDVRQIIDLLQHPNDTWESQLTLSGSASLGRK
jgi:hypothetical protein